MVFKIELEKLYKYNMIKKYQNYKKKIKNWDRYFLRLNIYIWLILDKLLKMIILILLTTIEIKLMMFYLKRLISLFLLKIIMRKVLMLRLKRKIILLNIHLEKIKMINLLLKILIAVNWEKIFFLILTIQLN